MPIHDWPEQERPREKLIARGPTALSDAELLALFLGSGFGGRDAVQTARDLLQAHGPLRVLLDRPAGELARLPGLGPARSCTLAAGLELAHRYLAAELEHGEAVGNNPARSAATCSTGCVARPARSSWPCSWTTATA